MTMQEGKAAESAVDEALVERTIAIVHAHEDREAASLLDLGAHVLDSYYGGDEALVHSKSPTKAMSYARLLERVKAETKLGKRDLRRALDVAIVYRSLSESVRSKLEPSHLEDLARIDDVQTRRELAGRAASGELRGAALRAAVIVANASEQGGGRKPKQASVEVADAIERMLGDARAAGELRKRALRKLDPDERRTVAKRLDAAASELRALAKTLRSVR